MQEKVKAPAVALITAGLFCLPALARAQEGNPPAVVSTAHYLLFSGQVEAGAAATTGNTNVQTYTGALKVDGKTRDGWALTLRGSGIWAESNNVQSAGAFEAILRGDRKVAGPLSGYLRLSIDGDQFKGVDNRQGVGGGFSAVEAWRTPGAGFDHDTLKEEAGFQYYRVALAGTPVGQDIPAARVFAGYSHAFDKPSVFSEELEVLYDFRIQGRYLITSVTALTAKLGKAVAFKAAQTVKDDTVPDFVSPTDPTQGRFKEVDTLTTFALIVSF